MAILFLKPFVSLTKSFAPPGVIPMFLSAYREPSEAVAGRVEEMWIGPLKSKLVNI